MNFALGLLAGCLVGWAAFALFRLNAQQGLRKSVFIGLIGGGIGMQLAPLLTSTPAGDGELNVFGLIIAAITASALLVISSMVMKRDG